MREGQSGRRNALDKCRVVGPTDLHHSREVTAVGRASERRDSWGQMAKDQNMSLRVAKLKSLSEKWGRSCLGRRWEGHRAQGLTRPGDGCGSEGPGGQGLLTMT